MVVSLPQILRILLSYHLTSKRQDILKLLETWRKSKMLAHFWKNLVFILQAGRTIWRMQSESAELVTCSITICFHQNLKTSRLQLWTSSLWQLLSGTRQVQCLNSVHPLSIHQHSHLFTSRLLAQLQAWHGIYHMLLWLVHDYSVDVKLCSFWMICPLGNQNWRQWPSLLLLLHMVSSPLQDITPWEKAQQV